MKGRYIFFTITAVILPFVLLMNAILLVFTPSYLVHEYRSADFPEDPYGFTLEERIEYGTESVRYITDRNYADDHLSTLQMKDGTPLYNERETSHMYDVRVVFRTARFVMSLMIVFIIITALLVTRKPDSLRGFLRSLQAGSLLTIFLIILAGIAILTGFDAFFDAFHHLFFTGESWLFYESDSLIRLFPEKLWVDGFSLAAALTAGLAIIVHLVSLFFSKRYAKASSKA
ncbi:MAG: TIGR01906 family membrane protein [Anaerolineaceae bacterium]|nr:TIGR01906 family membrane protein [Anaerolineaceae bacterium]